MAGAAGFTITELLVVIAIVALLGGLGAGAFTAAHRRYLLQGTVAEVKGVLRGARNTSAVTHTPSWVVLDPVQRTATAHRYETLAEWSFEGAEDGDPAADAVPLPGPAGDLRLHGARPVAGRVGRGIRFGAGGWADAGRRSTFDVRQGLLVEAWVRHDLAPPVRPPLRERAEGGRTVRLRAERRRPGREPVHAIVAREGAFLLGMTPSRALVARVGDYAARTAGDVVAPGRWVRVSLRFGPGELRVTADGVERGLEPLAARGTLGTPRDELGTPPGAVPRSSAPLTISAPPGDDVQPFPGAVDEVRLRGQVEPVVATWPEHVLLVGWKRVVRFDRRGHLDPEHHEEPVRLAFLELPRSPEASSRTTTVIDYGRTFEAWAEERRRNQPGFEREHGAFDRRELEGRIEERWLARPGVRRVELRIDRLGVIQ